MRTRLAGAALLLAAVASMGQVRTVKSVPAGAVLPAGCYVGAIFVKTSEPHGLYFCATLDTWELLIAGVPGPQGPAGPQGTPGTPGATGPQGPQGPQGDAGTPGTPGAKGDAGTQGIQGIQGIQGNPGANGADGAGIVAGMSFLITTGTCPAGYIENTAFTGKTMVGTVAANGDVGGTGGSDSITPAGTVAWPVGGVPVFAGTQLATHLHAFGTIAVAAHTSVATKQGTASGNVVTTNTHTVSGSTAAITAGTPAGTVAWPTGGNVPTFGGASFDNRSAFVKVIVCKRS